MLDLLVKNTPACRHGTWGPVNREAQDHEGRGVSGHKSKKRREKRRKKATCCWAPHSRLSGTAPHGSSQAEQQYLSWFFSTASAGFRITGTFGGGSNGSIFYPHPDGVFMGANIFKNSLTVVHSCAGHYLSIKRNKRPANQTIQMDRRTIRVSQKKR